MYQSTIHFEPFYIVYNTSKIWTIKKKVTEYFLHFNFKITTGYRKTKKIPTIMIQNKHFAPHLKL